VAPAARIEAADGIAFEVDGGGVARVAWREPDWLGPIGLRVRRGGATAEPRLAGVRPARGRDELGEFEALGIDWSPRPPGLHTSVRAYRARPLLVFRIEAPDALAGIGSGVFDDPCVAWPWARPDRRAAGGLPADTRAFGHQYTEFALPTQSDASLAGFFLLPQRPAVVEPLWLLAPDGRALLLAPLDAFHEQVLAVPRGPEAAAAGLRCGWHGDLDGVPAGFATEWALWGGPGPRAALEAWGGFLRARHRTARPGRYADALLSHLSYWTDNGAAYWYRSEPGLGVAGTLAATAERLRRDGVPFRVFQLDSWFYPHEKLRPFDSEDVSVPPSGLVVWDARPDVLPEGIPALRRALGDPPLAVHCRHFSSASPYFELFEAWRDGDRAHPTGGELYERLLHQAAGWGVAVFEHDWLVECFLGVRGLRAAPGRARAWQEGVDRAAAEQGMTLQWCMASPADFFATLTLPRVTSIRTSGDYRYVIGPGSLWAWFLYTNALARALGLAPFKDVFLSRAEGSGRDGDPHAEMEALLAALSTGPVGVGDRLGRSDRALLLRTCRADGVLVKPDVPLAALERSFRGHAVLEPNALVGEAYSLHPAGRWTYLLATNVWRAGRPLRFRVSLADLGALRPREPVVAWDWRTRTARRLDPDGDDGFALELEPLAWDYRVLCPVLRGELALVGDPARYATAGDRRTAGIRATPNGVELDVLGAPGERVELAGWAARRPAGAWLSHPGAGRTRLALGWDAARGVWEAALALPPGGFARVGVEAA
jgi:hypothetical protein